MILSDAFIAATIQRKKIAKIKENDPCHRILGNVFLGNSIAFAQATHQTCHTTNPDGTPQLLKTNNPHRITDIITICPRRTMESLVSNLPNEGQLQSAFDEHNIKWYYVGKIATDGPEYWEALAYDCTFLDSHLSDISFEKESIPRDDFERIVASKKNVISAMPYSDWFQPIFQIIDEAVEKKRTVLIHCQAGQSRSATILAAYLIRHRNYTAKGAIEFLQRKRPCVNPRFLAQLEGYEQNLKK